MLISCPRDRTFTSFFDQKNIYLAEALGDVVWNTGGSDLDVDSAKKLICDCDAYITSWGAPKLDGELLEAAKKLKILAHLGADGLSMIGESAAQRGIRLTDARDYYTSCSAEGVLAYILAALRNIPEYSTRMKFGGEWKHTWEASRSLTGKTVGIINCGKNACQLAKLLSPFEVRILIYDKLGVPTAQAKKYGMECVTLNRLCEESDIISVHTPMHANYYHMVDSEQFLLMKEGVVLVDTSIGGLVNHNSLLAMLVRNRIFAVLDVYETEPPTLDNSVMFLPNLIVMPHMAGAAHDIRRTIAARMICECAEYVDHGIPPKHEVIF